MNDNKILTIIVPTYDMEAYLDRCLNSFVTDSDVMSRLEVIVVNDGGKDKSSQIAHSYRNNYPDTFSVIDKENGHYGSCVNVGLAAAHGRYTRMVDADDWVDTDALAHFVDALEKYDTDMAVSISQVRKEDGLLFYTEGLQEDTDIEFEHIYKASEFNGIDMKFNMLYCSHIVTFKTDILRAVKLHCQEGICYTDNNYVFYPLDHISDVVCLNIPLYQYFVGRENQSTQLENMRRNVSQIIQVWEPMFEYYVNHKNNVSDAVRANQQILLGTMMKWCYNVLARGKRTKEKEDKLNHIEKLTSKEPVIRDIAGEVYRYGFPLLSYWRKTGRFENNLITQIHLQYHRTKRLIDKNILASCHKNS